MDQLKIKMRQPHGKKLLQSLASDWQIYVLLLPVVIWFALWAYKPMGGLLIAFKRFDSSLGVWNSDFKGKLYDPGIGCLPDTVLAGVPEYLCN
jgi:putative aldouronate transport system permease protein